MSRPILLLALLVAGDSGCGYGLGYRSPAGVRTVAVPIFANTTFPLRREIEFDLTSAFRREIQARSGLILVDESSGPDMVVRGRITEFRERVVAEGPRDEKTESSVVATVELEVENYLPSEGFPGGTRDRLPPVSAVEPFSFRAGEGFAVGRARAIRNLAEKLVIALDDWDEADPLETPGSGGGSDGKDGDASGAPRG